MFWIIHPELCLLNCSHVPEKNVVLLSGWDYLYCPQCHMGLKLRRSNSVRDPSAIRPSTVGSIFILTGFYWHAQATSLKEKALLWQVSMPHMPAVARTNSRHTFIFCFKIIILWKVVWKAQFGFLRFQILCTTAWISDCHHPTHIMQMIPNIAWLLLQKSTHIWTVTNYCTKKSLRMVLGALKFRCFGGFPSHFLSFHLRRQWYCWF